MQHKRRRSRLFFRILFWSAGALLSLALVAVGSFVWVLRASLPALDGSEQIAGLSATVRIERDSLGVPTIQATNRLDLARATGFVHAQERYFQMDLLRRSSAGELSELFGPGALAHDQSRRIHRMRAVAQRVVAQLPPEHRAILEAYAAGANAGLTALGARPPEYLALRQHPAPWLPEDTILVVHTMAFDLQDADGETERQLGDARQALGEAAFAFYLPTGSAWEAALDDSRTPPAAIPTPEQFHAPSLADSGPPAVVAEEPLLPGSNAWAIGGKRTATGAALVADDMHLGLSLPNIWFRISLAWTDPHDPRTVHRVTGVSLAGVPTVVTGSNGHIAWGFTNATTDHSDVIDLDCSGLNADEYRTPNGWRRFDDQTELIRVAGKPPVTFRFRTTVWGPVLPDRPGRPLQAIRWSFHSPDAVNFRALDLAEATNVVQALDIAAATGIPAQNFVAGDAEGHIGWTLTGIMPNRQGDAGRLPASWAIARNTWDGWVPADQKPRVVDPPGGIIWSANQRMHGGEAYRRAGDGDFDLGARAGQIRDRLRQLDRATPADLLSIQLDHEARFLERWHALMLEHLDRLPSTTNGPSPAEVRQALTSWGRAASTNSAGYRLVHSFRRQLTERLLEPAVQRCRQAGASFPWVHHTEAPAWALLDQRPPHLLSRRFATYDDAIREALGAAVASCVSKTNAHTFRTWGEHNTVRIRHPMSQAVPQLSRWLDLASGELPGDSHMPRAQAPSFGASERFGVSPGRETEGYCHMPGGQSGHFLSAYYRAGHRDWAEGHASSFLPGPTVHQLILKP